MIAIRDDPGGPDAPIALVTTTPDSALPLRRQPVPVPQFWRPSGSTALISALIGVETQTEPAAWLDLSVLAVAASPTGELFALFAEPSTDQVFLWSHQA